MYRHACCRTDGALCEMGMMGGGGGRCRPGPTHVMYRPAYLQDGRLSCKEFMLAMHLCEMGRKGKGGACRPGPIHVMYRPAFLQDGRLSCKEFMLAMHLCEMGMLGGGGGV